MSEIQLVKPHSLPVEKAKALVQKAVDGLADEHKLNTEWHGDTLHFDRSGVHGQTHVTDSEIRFHATLGLLMRPFRAKLIDHIESEFDKLFLKRAPKAQTVKKTARAAR